MSPRVSTLAAAFSCSLLALGCGKKPTAGTTTALPEPEPVIAAKSATAEALCGALRGWDVMDGDRATATIRGRCIGKESTGWHFFSQLRTVYADQPEFEMHYWLGNDGRPRRAELRTPNRLMTFAWTKDSFRAALHGDLQTFESDAEAPIWVVPGHDVFTRELMFRTGAGHRGDRARHRAYIPERAAVVPIDFEFTRGDAGRVAAKSPVGTFAFAGDPERAAELRIASLDRDDGTPLYRAAELPESWDPSLPKVPQPQYALPAGLKTLDVSIPEDGDSQPALSGELVVREDLAANKRHAAVLFISGSGPQTRLGFVPGTSIDIGSHQIHDRLAADGFVVLRYDDRGVGDSDRGKGNYPGYRELIDDARRALATLAAQPQVDPDRITIIGHSEGALTASILAAEGVKRGRKRHKVAATVLLASPGRHMRRIIEAQIRELMAGKPQAELDEAIAKARNVHDAIEGKGEIPAESKPIAPYLRDLFAIEPLKNLERVKSPILLLQGAKDFQVSAEDDYKPLAQAIADKRAGGKGSRSALFEGLDHVFKHEPGRSSTGHYEDLTRKVDPAVMHAIADFVAPLLYGRPAGA